jgi:hypothetical protein
MTGPTRAIRCQRSCTAVGRSRDKFEIFAVLPWSCSRGGATACAAVAVWCHPVGRRCRGAASAPWEQGAGGLDGAAVQRAQNSAARTATPVRFVACRACVPTLQPSFGPWRGDPGWQVWGSGFFGGRSLTDLTLHLLLSCASEGTQGGATCGQSGLHSSKPLAGDTAGVWQAASVERRSPVAVCWLFALGGTITDALLLCCCGPFSGAASIYSPHATLDVLTVFLAAAAAAGWWCSVRSGVALALLLARCSAVGAGASEPSCADGSHTPAVSRRGYLHMPLCRLCVDRRCGISTCMPMIKVYCTRNIVNICRDYGELQVATLHFICRSIELSATVVTGVRVTMSGSAVTRLSGVNT